jgi:Leucine-rich repeat (LRR) protein
LDSQLHEVDIGHVVEVPTTVSTNGIISPSSSRTPTNRLNGDGNADDAQSHYTNGTSMKDGAESLASNDSSDAGVTRSTMNSSSAGGLFYGGGKSSGNRSSGGGVLFGKSSSLIFPTGVEPPTGSDATGGSVNVKRHKINILLDQCETVRFPFKKKLALNALGLTAADVPVKDLYGTNLGNTLHKLSLAGNRLSTIPPKLVTCLPTLKTLDLSQCELHQLPERWNLPQLKRLNLSHNRLTDFPEEVRESNCMALRKECKFSVDCPLTVYVFFFPVIEYVGRPHRTFRVEHVWQQSERDCCPPQPKTSC